MAARFTAGEPREIAEEHVNALIAARDLEVGKHLIELRLVTPDDG